MTQVRSVFHVLAALICAAPAYAQTIPVRTGDHADFTRLVLTIGEEREWSITQQGDDEWELELTPRVDGFDTSNSFDLIGRNRVSTLNAAETLTLNLACPCDVSSFRHDGRYLVIDVADPNPDAPRLEEQAPAREAASAAPQQALPDLASLLNRSVNLPEITPPSPVVIEDLATPTAPNPRLEEAAQIMAEQLARAAASGLLEVAADQPMTAGDPTESPPPEPETPPPTAEIVPVITPEATPDRTTLPIRAETTFDATVQLDLPIGAALQVSSCSGLPFDVANWSEGGSLFQNLGALRRDLYDDRDVLTADGATALAQHYLYYGFGAEAAFWLEQLDDPPEELLHLSTLVDGAPSAPFLLVEAADGCSDGELLWRYIAGAVSNPLSPDDTSSIQRAFGLLPPGLRDHIGPRLARQLTREGYAGTARNIRDTLHRGGRLDTVALRMLDLDMGLTLDATADELREELAEALRDDGDDPVTVLAHALAFDRSQGTLPAPSRLVTADALIRENGMGPSTDALWREALLGHAALGQIDEALNRLGDPARSDVARAEALTELLADRVRVGDTAALVVLAYSYGPEWRPEGSAAGRTQVRAITALRDEGLFEAAQILRDVRRPLILPTPEATAETTTNEAADAWLSRDWARLADVGSGPHATIASRLTRLEAAPPIKTDVEPPDLNALNEVIDDTGALRATIASLLEAPALP